MKNQNKQGEGVNQKKGEKSVKDMAHYKVSTATPRSSLACTTCRNRHVRCDGTKPHCNRCSSEDRLCEYTPSRRGGLTRAELAARRAPKDKGSNSSHAWRGDDHSTPVYSPPTPKQAITVSVNWPASPTAPDASDAPSLLPQPAAVMDPLIDLYYRHFHRHHPFLLPRRYMVEQLSSPARHEELGPLVASIRFIGSLYAKSEQATAAAAAMGESVRLAIRARDDALLPAGPSLAQCRLLYSIGSYWCGDGDAARREMDAALRIAMHLGMHRRESSTRGRSAGDPVLAESLRRTWWSIYVVDAWYAAIRKQKIFATRDVDVTADLPCEEQEYESGVSTRKKAFFSFFSHFLFHLLAPPFSPSCGQRNRLLKMTWAKHQMIPTPKTLHDFDNREFSPVNHVFSSFAYLIGATRGIASAIASMPEGDGPLPARDMTQTVDAIVEGWELLLPDCKREVLTASGDFDELMFQAFMSVHA